MRNGLQILFNDSTHTIASDAAGRVSMTDLWRAAGSHMSRKPTEWLRSAAARDFIATAAANLKLGISNLTQIQRGGRNPGAWAHWQIALSYAQWLSADFHMVVNESFRRYMEEERNPALKMERAIAKYESIGKDRGWIESRFQSIQFRRVLSKTLAARGGSGFAEIAISDIANTVVLGKTAAEFKAEMDLPRRASTRDHLEAHELAALGFFEAMTARRLDQVDAYGTSACITTANEVGDVVADAMDALSGPAALPAPEVAEAEEAEVEIECYATATEESSVTSINVNLGVAATEDADEVTAHTEGDAQLTDDRESDEATHRAIYELESGGGRSYSNVHEMLAGLEGEHDDEAVGSDPEDVPAVDGAALGAAGLADAERNLAAAIDSAETLGDLGRNIWSGDPGPKTPRVEEVRPSRVTQVLNAVRNAWR